MSFLCGIPSVTLEGEKADWERLYKRLERLPELGPEPEQWAAMLRPILRRFVEAFDGNPDVAFWERVVKIDGICALDTLSGWITAFCVWDADGKWLGPRLKARSIEIMGSVMTSGAQSLRSPLCLSSRTRLYASNAILDPTRSHSDLDHILDGVPYFSVDLNNIPAGYSEVDVLVDDNGEAFECKMVSGHVAAAISKTAEDGPFDTLSPAPQWFLYVKADKPRRGYEEEAWERYENFRKQTA